MRVMRIMTLAVAASLLVAGCGLFGGGSEEGAQAEATEGRALVPTFTPTAQGEAATPTPTIVFTAGVADTAPTLAVTQTAPASDVATVPVAATVAATVTPTVDPALRPLLTITGDLVNARTGPGLDYGLAGSATEGQQFDIVSRSQDGDWWQVCCISGEAVWFFEELASDENADNVPRAESVPSPAEAAAAPVAAAPVAAAPVAAAPVAAAPAPQPAPTDTPAPPAPAPSADPCADIGGDGCKFKLRGGPAFAPNGGGELKLTLAFIHSGIDGGQPQGSYFPVLLKDGQNLNVPDSVRSYDPSIGMREGPNGRYNYEYKIELARIPGNNVAGNYTIFVLDGNGERDSQDFNFSVPDGQGEVWIQFDQG